MIASARGVMGAAALAGAVVASRTLGQAAPPATDHARAPAGASALAPPAVLLAGAYWKQLTTAEKQAYVNGFLAGAAAEQVRVRENAGAPAGGGRSEQGQGGAPSAGLSIATVRASHALRFPFAPAVYAAQMDDYYWWENHAEVPIVDAMTEINERMMAPQEHGGPER